MSREQLSGEYNLLWDITRTNYKPTTEAAKEREVE